MKPADSENPASSLHCGSEVLFQNRLVFPGQNAYTVHLCRAVWNIHWFGLFRTQLCQELEYLWIRASTSFSSKRNLVCLSQDCSVNQSTMQEQSRNVPQKHNVVSHQTVNVNAAVLQDLLPGNAFPQTEGVFARTLQLLYADVYMSLVNSSVLKFYDFFLSCCRIFP